MNKSPMFHVFEINQKYYIYDYKSIEIFEIDKRMYNIVSKYKNLRLNEFVDNIKKERFDYYKDIIELIDEGLLFYEELDSNENEDKIHIPNSINITCGIGTKCNLDCEYCFIKEQELEIPNGEVNHVINILEYLKTIYDSYNKITITVTNGGEPFVYPDNLCKLVNGIRMIDSENKVSLVIVTNGTIFNKSLIEMLSEFNTILVFSIEGRLDNNKIRKSRENIDNYAACLENYNKIKLISRNSITNNIWASSVVNVNTTSLVENIKDLYNFGFRTIQMRLIKGMKDTLGVNSKNIEKFKYIYKELFDFFIKNIKDDNSEYIKTILNNGDFVGQLFVPLLLGREKFKRCLGALSTVSIGYDGKIYPCGFLNGMEDCVINYLSEDDSVVQLYREITTYNIEKCFRCWAKTVCGGHCPYQSISGKNKFNVPDSNICDIIYFIVENIIYLIDYMETNNFEIYEELYNFVKKRTYLFDILY